MLIDNTRALQQDLNILFQWSTDWQILTLTNVSILQHLFKKHPLTSQYTLNGSQTKHVPSTKYLGVIINSNHTWSDHGTVRIHYEKASNVRAFLHNTVFNQSRQNDMNLMSIPF